MFWLLAFIVLMLVAGCESTPSAPLPQAVKSSPPPPASLVHAAEQGDVNAQYELGAYYYHKVEEGNVKAFPWFEKAAEQGHLQAQAKLAGMYFYGWGVQKDPAQGIHWYREAAEQGEVTAQLRLGELYRTGQGVPKDLDEAEYWYRQAANQGDRSTQRLAETQMLRTIKERDPAASEREKVQLAEKHRHQAEERILEAERIVEEQRQEAARLAEERKSYARDRFGTLGIAWESSYVLLPLLLVSPVGYFAVFAGDAALEAGASTGKQKALERVLKDPEVHRLFPEQIIKAAQARLHNPVLMVEYLTEDQTGLTNQGIDTVVEVSGLTIGFIHTRYTESGAGITGRKVYRLSIGAEYRLIDPSDQTIIDQHSLQHEGPGHQLSEWEADDAKLFREVLEAGYKHFAEQVIEHMLTRPFLNGLH